MKRAFTVITCAILGTALLVAGCAGSTKFVSSWRDPGFQEGSVKKVFVVGVSRNQGVRHVFEDTFVKSLAGSKIDATPSYQWFPELDLPRIDKEAAAARLRDEGFTHVIVSRLVDQKTVETYVPSTVVVGGYGPAYPGYYGGWYPYMSTAYVASPGYVTSNEVYSIETNLYDLSKKEGVSWSGLTNTTVSSSAESEIQGLISTVVYEMKSKKVF